MIQQFFLFIFSLRWDPLEEDDNIFHLSMLPQSKQYFIISNKSFSGANDTNSDYAIPLPYPNNHRGVQHDRDVEMDEINGCVQLCLIAQGMQQCILEDKREITGNI